MLPVDIILIDTTLENIEEIYIINDKGSFDSSLVNLCDLEALPTTNCNRIFFFSVHF